MDAAIDAGTIWDISYRFLTPTGEDVWVRERGKAVYEAGELVYLEGLIVRAEAEVELREQLVRTLKNTQANYS